MGHFAAPRIPPWPKRVDVAVLCFLAQLIAYCDRVNMSVSAPSIMREYHWDTARMGWAFAGFFLAYIVMMIPAGMLADRSGPKRVLALGMGWWSVFTALTPLPRSLASLTATRIVMGAGESGTLPAINCALVRWFPKGKYSRATGLAWSGGYGGSIVAFPLATAILAAWGWRAVFYLFALLGAFWLPFWLLGASDRPELCRGISAAELKHITASRPDLPGAGPMPWRRFLSLPSVWAVLLLHFSSNWVSYVMISWLPTYLMSARRFSLASMALGATLPFVCSFISTNMAASLMDRLTPGRNRTRVRKWFLLPYAGCAFALLLVPRAANSTAIVGLLCAAMALLTSVTPVYSSNSLDLAPRYAGTFVAVQNGFANTAGVLAPVVIGYVAKDNGWGVAFAITAAVIGLGVLAFLLFGATVKLLD